MKTEVSKLIEFIFTEDETLDKIKKHLLDWYLKLPKSDGSLKSLLNYTSSIVSRNTLKDYELLNTTIPFSVLGKYVIRNPFFIRDSSLKEIIEELYYSYKNNNLVSKEELESYNSWFNGIDDLKSN